MDPVLLAHVAPVVTHPAFGVAFDVVVWGGAFILLLVLIAKEWNKSLMGAGLAALLAGGFLMLGHLPAIPWHRSTAPVVVQAPAPVPVPAPAKIKKAAKCSCPVVR